MGDYQPLSETYTDHWKDATFENVKQEVARLVLMLFSDDIMGDHGKRIRLRDQDKAHACKTLCALARHESKMEQLKRQQLIGKRNVVELLLEKIQGNHDLLQYWAVLLILQLMFNNMPCCAIAVDAGATQVLVRMVHLGEKTQEMVEAGEDPFSSLAVMRRPPVKEHVLLVCLMALRGLATSYLDAHAIFRQGERDAEKNEQTAAFQKTTAGQEDLPRGIITVCCRVILRGRQQHYPVMDTALRFMVSLADNAENIKSLMAAHVPDALRVHMSTDSSEGIAARATMTLISTAAVQIVQKVVRGHKVRRMLLKDSAEVRMRRLASFWSRFKLRTYLRSLKESGDKNRRVKEFMKRLMGRQTLSLVARMLESMTMYVEQSAARALRIEDMRATSIVVRNTTWDAWVGHMEGEVAALNAAVASKCKNVLLLMTGETVGRCFQEWKGTTKRTKIIKRRWLHSSLDRAMRAWKECIATMLEIFRGATEKLRGTLALLSDDLCVKFFTHWAKTMRRNKITMARFRQATEYAAWGLWCDALSETMDVVTAVQTKCQKILALLHSDSVHSSFTAWSTFTRLEKAERAVIFQFNRKLVAAAFGALADMHNELVGASEGVRDKCKNLLRYLAVGCVEDTFDVWKEDTRKTVRARKRWKNQSMTHIWNVWTKEIIPRQRKIARCRELFIQRAQRMFLHLWHSLVADKMDKKGRLERILTKWFNKEKAEAFEKLAINAKEAIHHRELLTRIRRSFDLRHARSAIQQWGDTTHKAVRLRRLVLRIKSRVLTLFFEILQKQVDDKNVKLRQELFSKSPLIVRFLKRPMFQTYALWRDLVAEGKRKEAVLARLRFRMQNGCLVMAIHSMRQFVISAQDDRRALLRCAIADGYRHGTSEELRSALSGHPIWRKVYTPLLLREVAEIGRAHV